MARQKKFVNMNKVSDSAIATFNQYFIAITDEKDALKEYTKKIKKCEEEEIKMLALRAEAQAEGKLSFDEIVAKYDLCPINDKKAGLEFEKKEASKARAKAERDAARFVTEEMYNAYKAYIVTGGHNAMRKSCEDFLEKIGVEFVERTSTEFCNRLVACFGKTRQTNTDKIREGEFTKMLKKDAFFKLAMSAILECLGSYGALEIKDGILVKAVFDEPQAQEQAQEQA